MSKVFVTESYLDDIADAIRGKNGTENTYKPPQMAAAITALPDLAVLDDKTITANGTYDPSDDDLDGYSEVTVNVPNSYAAGDEGKVVSSGALVSQSARSSNITENGTYDTTLNNSVTVNVAGGGNNLFVSETAGDSMTGWYQSRTITRTLASGYKLIAAPWRFDAGYVSGAFYTLHDYGAVGYVISGNYPTKVEIPNVTIPNYGTVTVYAYGGMDGSGNGGSAKLSKSIGLDNTTVEINMSGSSIGTNKRFGITNDTDFGTAFNTMSSELQNEFLTSLLLTL